MQGNPGHPYPCNSENTPDRCAATSTSQGMINLDHDVDEEWLIYIKATEAAFLGEPKRKSPERQPAALRPLAKSADGLWRRTPTLSKNKSIVLENRSPTPCNEIIFDARADGDKAEDVVSIPMRNSLFPHVPPYVLFHSHDQRHSRKKLPKDFTRLLRWKISSSMPRILARILSNSGYQLVTKGNEWSGAWYPGSSDNSKYKRLQYYQKVKIGNFC